MESVARGGTRWKRFALVMVPSVVATAAIGIGLSQGALAASFSISGQEFKVKAKELKGKGFVQYGSMASGKDLEGKSFSNPVAVSGFRTATITNMCQSVVTPLPFGMGHVSLELTAGTNPKKPVEAEGLYLDVSDLETSNAEFTKIDIGVAAGKLEDPGIQPGTRANEYGFSQRAESVVLTDVRQKAWATTAGTFKLPDLKLKLHKGAKECFAG